MGEGKGNGSGSVVVRQVSSIGSSSLWSSLSPRGLYRTREWPAEWGLEFIIRPRAPRRSQKQWENERGSSPARQRSRATLACRSPLSRPRSRSRVLHSLSLSLVAHVADPPRGDVAPAGQSITGTRSSTRILMNLEYLWGFNVYVLMRIIYGEMARTMPWIVDRDTSVLRIGLVD